MEKTKQTFPLHSLANLSVICLRLCRHRTQYQKNISRTQSEKIFFRWASKIGRAKGTDWILPILLLFFRYFVLSALVLICFFCQLSLDKKQESLYVDIRDWADFVRLFIKGSDGIILQLKSEIACDFHLNLLHSNKLHCYTVTTSLIQRINFTWC